VDVTVVNPGFDGHKFPWHWHAATVAGEYASERFVEEPVFCEAGGAPYGFTRSLEAGRDRWQRSLALRTDVAPIRIERRK